MNERKVNKKNDRQQHEEETASMWHQPQVLAVSLQSYVDEVFPHINTHTHTHEQGTFICECERVKEQENVCVNV